MFKNKLLANRGDQPPVGGAAALPNCVAAESRKRYFTAETIHV